jgi:glycosyltransferase involved in cell wall biosynthesis
MSPETPRPLTRPRFARAAILDRLRTLALDVADALPPPRDEAFLNVARSVRDLFAGHAPGAYQPSALPAGDRPMDRATASALRQARDRARKRGEMTELVLTVAQLRRGHDSVALASEEELWLGRLAETDVSWLPWVPPRTSGYDARPGVVLHLLKQSLPHAQNGYTMRSRYTLLAQREAGLEPVVATSLGFPRREGVTDFEALELVDGIPHHRLDLGSSYPTELPWDRQLGDQAWLAAQVAERERPAIIHAASGYRGYELALVGLALRRRLGVPLVYEVRSFHEATWSPDQAVAESGEQFRRRHAAETRCMHAADAVITIADAMRDEIVSRGVPPERVSVIPNGVDGDMFVPRPADPSLKRRYGLEGRAVIGYVSNLDHPREGHELLIDATAILVKHGRKIKCLIVGDGKRRAELERYARGSGARDAVVFTGSVPHELVPDVYALMDVFVVPRRDEFASRHVTPLKPFEAMAMGRAMLVADLPALLEIVKPGERGLTFAAGDPGALAKAAGELLDRADLRARLGEEARRWVVAERGWTRNGERYRAIYESLTPSGAQPRGRAPAMVGR